jgi:hypothetical protein
MAANGRRVACDLYSREHLVGQISQVLESVAAAG